MCAFLPCCQRYETTQYLDCQTIRMPCGLGLTPNLLPAVLSRALDRVRPRTTDSGAVAIGVSEGRFGPHQELSGSSRPICRHSGQVLQVTCCDGIDLVC